MSSPLERLALRGRLGVWERRGFPLEAFCAGQGGVQVAAADNLITDAWFNQLFIQISQATGYPYWPLTPAALAIGDGNGAAVVPAVTDVELVHETFRFPLVAPYPNNNGLGVNFSFYSPAADGTYSVEEAGLLIFQGPPAGPPITDEGTAQAAAGAHGGSLYAAMQAGVNVGVLMSHLAYVYTKPAAEDIRYQYTIVGG